MIITSKNKSNYQDLLKVLAIIAMIIDHIGLYLYPEMPVMRVIGRISMPIFCFFAGYNFHNKPKHKIIILGVLLQIYTDILFKQFLTTNILIPIYLGQWYLYYFRNNLNNFFYSGYCHVVVLAMLWCVSWFLIDYGTVVIAIMVLGHIARHDPLNLRLCIFISLVISLLHTITGFNLSDSYTILTIILSITIYILMITRDFTQKTTINLKWLSRHTISIYCIHLAIIQFILIYIYTAGLKNWWLFG
ncbi:TraX family protein [Rickettsia endosymbiont of Halotydeus destructor]|uniref:TraX family protein n=1 Tax=Rickettsia endosymbiont of Halotydeus destructor TaxID=2996754 RepID=UPI003BB03C70